MMIKRTRKETVLDDLQIYQGGSAQGCTECLELRALVRSGLPTSAAVTGTTEVVTIVKTPVTLTPATPRRAGSSGGDTLAARQPTGIPSLRLTRCMPEESQSFSNSAGGKRKAAWELDENV